MYVCTWLDFRGAKSCKIGKKRGSMFLSVQVFKFWKEHDGKTKGKNVQKCVIRVYFSYLENTR